MTRSPHTMLAALAAILISVAGAVPMIALPQAQASVIALPSLV